MNNVNIFHEYQELLNRRGLNRTDISIATGVSRQAVRQWTNLKGNYVSEIASSCGDDRFFLATLCYFYKLPSGFLSLLDRYNDDRFSLLLGTKKEDLDSDKAINDLLGELSKKTLDKHAIALDVKEILETGIYMILYAMKIIRENNIPMMELIKEV